MIQYTAKLLNKLVEFAENEGCQRKISAAIA